MKNVKQTLTEELNKMKYMLGYQRGVVISEQEITPKQQEALNAGYGPVTDATAKTLPVGADGKILPKPSNTNPSNAKLSIRQLIERDIATEKLGLTWAQVKGSFGSTGQGAENQMLYKAWKGGWRPGQPVPDQFQTPTYKQKVTQTTSGTTSGVTSGVTSGSTEIKGSEQVNLLQGLTPENADTKIDQLKSKAKEAKQQRRADRKTCKEFADAIDSKGFFKRINKPVADQEICDILRFCIAQGLVENGRGRDFSGCDAFPAKSVEQTTTTTTVPPSPVNKKIEQPVTG